jgi:ABC-type antimicrobial peptide transport system permease subunit
MTEVVVQSTARQDFNMLLLTIFGGSALILDAIGIYGLMAYSVEQRTQEMGIRMALGADRSRIRSLVVWHGMRLAIIGVVIGIGAVFGLTRLIASFLFGFKTWDPPDICNRTYFIKPGRAPCRLDAGHPRLAPRPAAGAPHRVTAHFLPLASPSIEDRP